MSAEVILLGAARSGTKILRDTIALHSCINSVPFDINFVWKWGKYHVTHDQLSTEDITPKTARFIQKYLDKYRKEKELLVEKTVSNTIRINHVDAVLYDPYYIYLFRNGFDVIESVSRQWGTTGSSAYIWEKLLSMPLLKVWPYLVNVATSLIQQKIKGSSDDYVWGVKHKDYRADLKSLTHMEFIAKQWIVCVEHMLSDLHQYRRKRIIIRYENLVDSPDRELTKIFRFLNCELELIEHNIVNTTVNKGFDRIKDALSIDTINRITELNNKILKIV